MVYSTASLATLPAKVLWLGAEMVSWLRAFQSLTREEGVSSVSVFSGEVKISWVGAVVGRGTYEDEVELHVGCM